MQQELIEFANATSSKKTAKAPTKEAGTEELQSSGNEFVAPTINAETIYNLRHNVYASGLIRKLIRLVFQSKDKFTVEVYEDKSGVQVRDDKLTAKFMKMAERQGVRLWVQMKKSLKSDYYWGIYLSNPVWGQDVESGDTDIQLLKVRHLHSYTFKTSGGSSTKTWSEILPGITLNEKSGDMEFWQEPELNATPVLIKKDNIFWVKDPSDDGLTGDPMIIPIIPVVGMLTFVWNAEMQHCNRVGAGGDMIIKLTNPQLAGIRNGNLGDVDYCNAVIKKSNKDTRFVFRENMELLDSKTKHDTNNLEIIDALTRVIQEYVTLGSFMSSSQTTRLGGNESSQKELLYNSIINLQETIAEQWEILLMRYFDYNQFPPGKYSVKIKIPPPQPDDPELEIRKGEALFLTQSGNEALIRKYIDPNIPAMTDAELTALREWYKTVVKTPTLIRPP